MFIKKKLLLWLLYITMSRPPSRLSRFPSSFKTCDRKQRDFDECLKEAATRGLRLLTRPYPQLGLPSLSTVLVGSLKVAPGEVVGFEQDYENLKFLGFTNATFEIFNVNFEDNIIAMECHFPAITQDFDYNWYGHVKGTAFYGKGHGIIIYENMKFFFILNLGRYQKTGNSHFRVKNSKLSMDNDFIRIYFDTLYSSSGIDITEELNKEFNRHSRELFLDVRPKYEKIIGQMFSDVFDRFFSVVPINDLFGEE